MGEPFWKVLGAVAAASAVWVPFIVWITKRLVEHKLSTTMEAYRSNLAIVVKERELRFGALVAKRASGLVDVFTALDNAYGASSISLLGASVQKRHAIVPTKEVDAAVDVYRPNLLYMDTGLSERIEQLFGDIRQLDTVDPSKAIEYSNKLKAQRDSIEADFRVLLGSELSPPPPRAAGA
jgi:hypothetical protein